MLTSAFMRLRYALGALLLVLPCTLVPSFDAPPGPSEAHAAVSVLVSMEELVGRSTFVVVAKPVERRSVWEELGGSRRIVTYTKLEVESSILGGSPSTIEVRTLGGSVGRIGQHVSGEAQFRIGQTAMVFVADLDGVNVVAATAQGHYPIASKEGEPRRLTSSPDPGTLLPRKGPIISAREVLVGATLETASAEVLRTRRALDDKR
jgi:hypothetical protein